MIRLHSFETLGTLEGPGIRLIVFLQGCNAECVYCHNPDTWPVRAGKLVGNEVILDRVRKEVPYFGDKGGVTISGGEPLVQQEALIPLMREIKELGVHTAMETNGSVFNDVTRELLDYTDLLLLDLKHINPEWQKKITGVSYHSYMEMARYREEKKQPFWIRYVLMPGFTDQEEYILEAAQVFKDFEMLERVEILPYHTLGIPKYAEMGIEYQYKDVKAPTHEQIMKAKSLFEKFLRNVHVME